MKVTFKIALVLFAGFLLNSCLNLESKKKEKLSLDTDFKTATINEEYEMSIPDYMSKTTSLNDEASLQYQNIYKETYVAVIDEFKDEFIPVFKELGEYNDSISPVKNYRDIQLKFLAESISIDRKSEIKSIVINGLDAETINFDGEVEGVAYDITYFMTFVESEEKVYMIMAWTLKGKKDKYEETYKMMAESFRLLSSEE